MKHLSGMDATFFHVETPETPMHVGSLCVVSLPEGYTGDYYEDYKAQIGSRLHLAEVFERKLALMPFELSNPIWVDDDDVDLDYHVRRIILSKPGTFQQLEQYVARLLEPDGPQPAAVGALCDRRAAKRPDGDLLEGSSRGGRRTGRRRARQGAL